MALSGMPLDSVIQRFTQLPIFLSKNSVFSTFRGYFWSKTSGFFDGMPKVINGIQPNLWECPLPGDFNCSSLPAGLGGNGEFERKFEEILGTLRNFERK